ncbi:caspase-8-like isoform X3 [Dermochelys coriacea]|uniref:caspase-8-like isoform X3 n=1 Tax=Dermochelys coriacea TaxID=27794 RepID=UPI001CA9064B|nr:caspase-8-like isoform X3 [Dermochelys coriacea]
MGGHKISDSSSLSHKMSADIYKLLFFISEELDSETLMALKFLSLEYIPLKNQENIQDPKDFFQKLQKKGLIEEDDLSFLKELMFRVNRIDLLTGKLSSSRDEMEKELQIPNKAKVSRYRQLLYRISEEITSEEVASVRFLLQKELPKKKLQDNATILKLFIEMEKAGIMNETKLKVLKSILQEVRPDLVQKINTYEVETQAPDELITSLEPPFQSLTITEGHIHQEVPCSKTCAFVGPGELGAKEAVSVPKLENSYRMDNNPHGYCVILNNSDFKNPDETRRGTDKDAEALKQVFEWLQFETIEHRNLEAKEIHETIKKYSKMDHSNMDCFICCLLSHGKKACQGKTGQKSIPVEEDYSRQLETDALPFPSIPDWADILISMATVEDFECYRYIERGSAFIQCLCKEIESFCPQRMDLLTILTQVNKEMGEKDFNGKKQMPEIKSTLRKQLIFQMSTSDN